MMGLAKFLVETILGEAAEMDKVVVVYSGRFQPFHKGHYATYDHLVKKFGRDSVYIGTSDVTDSKKSPFGFKEKKAIMMKMFGISSNKIVQIKNPYAPQEILNKFDSDTTGFITVVGEKDSSRLSGKYFTPYKGKVEEPYLDKGYVYAAPAQPNAISGTDVRYWLSSGNEEERKKNFTKAYPKFDDQIFKLITLKLKKLKECINEEIKLNVKVGDTLLMGKFKNKKVVVKNIGTDEWGMPTINGKKAVTFRIPKKEQLKEAASNSGFSGQDEPDTSFVADGQPRILNTAKPENWYKQGGYTQLDTPKADAMRGRGKTKDTETQFRKAYYKLKNVTQSTLNPADDPHKVEDWDDAYRENPEQKPKRFWELPKNQKPQIISKEDINEIMDEMEAIILGEMGLGGGAGVGLSLPGGYINGAPDPKDAKKLKSKLNGDGSEEYTPVKEATSSEIIKDLDKVKTDLLKKADILIAKKKKLYSNVDIESPMSADEKKLNKEIADLFSEIQQLILQKRKIKNESINESLLLEGGAYGHMNHPFDIEMNLTFGDLKTIVTKALNGDLELTREKTDGQALAVSWVNGRLVAARNKSHLKSKGAGAMTIGQVADKFAGRGGLTDAYNFAMQDLSKAIAALSEPQRQKIFKDGACFMNLEVIYPTSVNVIPYNQPLLVFHGTFEYDDAGTIIGENQQAASILGGMIKQVNAHVQSKYTIQGPPMTKLPKSEDLAKLQGKYLGMISKLQSEFGLADNDGVGEYHQAWWSKFVEKGGKKLDAQEKIGLVKRWAFGDKAFRIATIQDVKLRAWAEQIDKQDQQKISKQNLMRFEEIFLGVGADVLSFMESVLTANPDSAKRQMVARLQSTISQVKASGDPKKVEKLKLELQRLNALGGFDKIVPNEGIVFVYNGNTYKLTGAFAPLNQILGIFFDS